MKIEFKDFKMSIQKEITKLNDKVTQTYKLALDAWGQSTENRNWLSRNLQFE